ncbi:hypothetical protein KSP39_PZI001569 [Platanthera zijinensis]|uniref:Uncharacterized protein n=1 Tax=Platanthera zijinensis TaxID=2320716 RepID=A0AAP0C3I6_9ASPA
MQISMRIQSFLKKMINCGPAYSVDPKLRFLAIHMKHKHSSATIGSQRNIQKAHSMHKQENSELSGWKLGEKSLKHVPKLNNEYVLRCYFGSIWHIDFAPVS